LNRAPRAPCFPSGSHPLSGSRASCRNMSCTRVFRSKTCWLLFPRTRYAERFGQAASKGRLRTSPTQHY
jgi:hypothetical protein